MASLVMAICFSASVSAQDADQEQMMNLVLQVQALQDEVRQLRGQLEEQGYELESLRNRQRDQYVDLDKRLNELRGGGSAATVPSVGPAAVPSAAPREDVPEVRAPVTTSSSTVALPDPQVDSRVTQATPEMEQESYDRAFQALKELRYADAAEGFQAFLKDYPDSALASNAQYWLGESYYVTRNYDIALGSFQRLLNQYPDSSKAGDGLLKIGFTHYELKQWSEARAALEQVQQRYPNTTLARLAESRLRSMKLEGNM
jgi:tol-pal system protein YbgF